MSSTPRRLVELHVDCAAAHQPCAADDAESFRTPLACPAPAPHEAPEPQTLEFRSATKLKERRRQRQIARSPYARTRPAVGRETASGVVVASAGARRKLLEDEKQRLLGLPRGEVWTRLRGVEHALPCAAFSFLSPPLCARARHHPGAHVLTQEADCGLLPRPVRARLPRFVPGSTHATACR